MDQSHDAPSQPEKKIIIDEDWKAQVQAEKEKAAPQPQKSPAGAAQAEARPLPPPSLTLLATTLGMQAMMALGMVPDPAGKAEVHLDQARHFIDTLAMLQEKTEGNRTPEETSVLENLLHQLRMSYVAVGQQSGT